MFRLSCRFTILLLVCALSLPVSAAANSYFSIDRDGDGYGVGEVGLKGPDADDSDPTVNTPASVKVKYLDLSLFLAKKNYHPDRIIVVCAEESVFEGNCSTWSDAKKTIRPGDLVLFREGTYHHQIKLKNVIATKSHPIVLMAYPGERVLFDNCGSGRNSACFDFKGVQGIVVDGIWFDNAGNNGVANGIYANGSTHYDWGPVNGLVIRNVLAKNLKTGFRGMQNVHGVRIENSVVHDTLSHAVYFGTRHDQPSNTDISIENSIFYRAAQKIDGRFCVQHNGMVDLLRIEKNICHSNFTGGGISIVNGATEATLKNNLIFNNAKQGIVFYAYKGKSSSAKKRDFLNNRIINNTIWVGKNSVNGDEKPLHHPGIHFNDSTGKIDILYTEIRNNIIATQSGTPIEFLQEKALPSTVIKNNLFFNTREDTLAQLLSFKAEDAVAVGKTKYNVDEIEEMSDLISNNSYAAPGFRNASIDLFKQPAKFDFRLSADSPARDFSQPLPHINLGDDLFGNLRNDGRIDAGCYEYGE
ncbi:Right handed beta helix region [Malonomonas rubra DSM 5091]|uniref:Right handed beta helix region n=1 Tax=Malonomonas rubra DSM 5091 TaxID=1122189 RepID=A0A1M6KD35_MALRU|nr:right-handed parallel beta-helix repeat-containing protein [Malonomonas rubra]SHJ56866.1 Right handed beta helix region [Malonomonas rubra DSM 5091]